MIVLPSGDVVSDDEDEFAKMLSLIDEGDDSEVEVEATTEHVGVALVARRVFPTQVKRVDETHRDNIFYTRCHVKGRVCSLIIDTVIKQVVVHFRIGKYEDEILCDVIPMQASHILLGRPWQYDKKTTHDGFTNKYSFLHHNKKMILVPLTPQQMHEDQLRLQQEHERELAKKSTDSKAIIKAPVKRTSTPGSSSRMEKRSNLFAKNREIRNLLLSKQVVYVLYCKEVILLSHETLHDLPLDISSLLQEFENVFPDEISNGLPPLRGIEHQIDFILGTSLPNRPAYKMDPEETNEIQRQVDELLERGWARESMSPCAVLVILIPKKEGT
ncbi:uncharacterized protein [Coffea arabica]|uniref:Transposon Ty3-I Gag-Pol polyprotein n=1 Tax=Coffea arabica TaxID=13443 RepID=A0A6P6VJ08_COFAR|nr:uncharacterized protein LOC113724352 [Coffea arabica]